jgi:ATP-dependent Lhr-like helicase
VNGLIKKWFTRRKWKPFPFQFEAIEAFKKGESGLIHAPTGVGKTLAAWLPLVSNWLDANPNKKKWPRRIEPLRLLWITPLRALAGDTVRSLLAVTDGLGMPWRVESRTGDTSSSRKAKQRLRFPTALVTTPESLTLLLSYPETREAFATLECVVVDEWHELMSTKRGVQTELALARLRQWTPNLKTWGLSATVGNLDQAMEALLGGQRGTLTAIVGHDVRSAEPLKEDPQGEREQFESGGEPLWQRAAGRLITAEMPKEIRVDTVLPQSTEKFPWIGHLGLKLLPEVVAAIDSAKTTLVFTNVRSQTEIWFRALLDARPDWEGKIGIHHGSLDRKSREAAEQGLLNGTLRAVVCTSSLDLGVDFTPVEQVLQIGGPKGVARLIQRAGRSGHQPGSRSRVLCVPTHALELLEYAAAREEIARHHIEPRRPLEQPVDVLSQHMVTVALGSGFTRDALFDEVRTTRAYRNLSRQAFDWVLEFVIKGGRSLRAYPEYCRVVEEDGRCFVASKQIARFHRLSIGTITSDNAISVQFLSGKRLGSVEESFIARIRPGGCFVFAGRLLKLVRVHQMTAQVRAVKKGSATIPVWEGGRLPLSSLLADAVREQLELGRNLLQGQTTSRQRLDCAVSPRSSEAPRDQLEPGRTLLQGQTTSRQRLDCAVSPRFSDVPSDAPSVLTENIQPPLLSPELQTVLPILEIQAAWSQIPAPDELLIENTKTREGTHWFLFPFGGRLAHEGLGSLLAYRLSKKFPVTVTISVNDYGLELLPAQVLDVTEEQWREVLNPDGLLDDLLACLNATELARRQFREIARVAGLVFQGYPGAGKPARQVQASSSLFFEVFTKYEPEHLLLDQARREVLDQQLEINRLRVLLEKAYRSKIIVRKPENLTPLAFPLWAEMVRAHVTSESWSDRVRRMAAALETEATKS